MTKWKGEAASYAPNLAQLVTAAGRTARAVLFPALLLLGLAAGHAAAADLYWDVNNSGVGIGGTGTWDTGTSSWNTTGNDVAGPFTSWNSATPDNAIFQGTAGTVTLGAPITAGGLTFNVNGYTIAGGTLTLGGATPTITGAGSATISSVVAGSAGLTKAGAGVLTLTGANTFTGGVIVNGGTLSVGSDAALGNISNSVTLNDGTTFSATGALSASRQVVLNGAVTFSGAVGSGLITGTGTLSLFRGVAMSNDANTYTGTTITNAPGTAGTVSFTSVRNTGQASSLGSSGDILLRGVNNYLGSGDTTNRTFRLQPSSNAAVSLVNAGTGTLALTGTISLEGGPRAVSFAANNADIDLSGSISGTNTAPVTYTGGGTLRTITLGGPNTYTGGNSISSVTVKVSSLADRGTASSLGTNDNTGVGVADIQINNGTLSYTGGGNSSNRTWTYDGATTIRNDGSGALTLSGAASFVAGGTDSLTLGGSYTGADNTMSGVISGTGNLISSGNSTWVLTGANTRTGTITVNGGTLRAGSASAFGTTTGITTSAGTLDLNGFNLSTTSLSGTGGTLALGGAELIVNSGTGVNNSYGGSITGSGSLTKLGAGSLTLTGANAYTGTTNVGGGTLALDFSPAGGPTSNIISGASGLIMNGGTVKVTGAAGETNVQSFSGLTITTGNNTVSATSGTGGSTTINLGSISRTGGLANFVLPTAGAITTSNLDGALGGWATVNGSDYAKVLGGNIVAFTTADYVNKDNASTWLANEIISDAGGAANTPYFGTVGSTVQIGGLQYTAAANSTVNVANGQTLGVDGTIIVAPSVGAANQTITGGSMTGTLGGGVLGIQQNGAGIFTIASTIVDNGGATGFAKAGAGRVALSGPNTYTGATTISGGTLSVNTIANGGQASALGASGSASSNLVIEGATLQYTGATATSDRGFTLATSGAVTAATIDVSSAGTNLTFSGQVTSPDNAGLTKIGAGTLTLSNATSNYSGATTVSAGTLSVGTLANGGAASSIGASTSDSSNLVLQSGGTLQYTGATVTSDRGFTLNGIAGGAIEVTDANTTLTLTGTAVGIGAAPLTKEGAGTLVLSGTNTYTGGTTVGAGTLRAGSTQAFGTGAMTVNAGATLDLAGFANTVRGLGGGGSVLLGGATLTTNGNGSFSGTISGTGGVTVAAGAQTFSGCTNSYAGATTINGTLSVSCLRNGLQPSDIGASSKDSANLQISSGTLIYTGGSVTTDRGFTLTGTGTINVANAATKLEFSGIATGTSLQKTGAGTLILSGANTYNGATYVNGGTVRAGSTSAFGTSGLRMDTTGATLDLNNFDNTVAYISQVNLGIAGGNITLGSATLTIRDGSNGNYNGAISGTGGLVKNGAGAQSLSGSASSYTGPTVINGGILALASLANGGSNSSIGASTSDASNLVINGGVLRYNGTGDSTDRQFTLGANGGGLDAYASGPGPINFTSTAPITMSGTGNRTLQLAGLSTADNTLSARIDDPTGGATSLTKTGTGTWVLANAASTYTGKTTISGGVLAVDKLADGGQASSIGRSSNAASNLVIGSGSTLRYTGSGDTTDRLFTLSTGTSFIESSGSGAIVFSNTGSAAYTGSGNRTLALGGTNTGLNTMGGTIVDGPGGVTTLAKNDSGTWVLTGNNTFTGNTVINDGNLIIGNGGTTGNAGAGNVIIANATSTLSFNRSDAFTFSGLLSGPGTIAQIGTGSTILTAAGNSVGATRVDAGTLQVNSSLTSAGGITINAGTLQAAGGGAAITTPTITMNAGSKLNIGGGTVQAAGGIQTLFTGGTGGATINITGGTLLGNGTLAGGGNIVNLTAGSLNTGAAALNLGSGNDTFLLSGFATIAGAGVDGGGGTDTFQVNTTFSRTLDGAQIAGFESLNKQGAATLTLTGNHSYSAGTTISGGTLQIGNGATAGALTTPTVTNNGALAFNLNSNYSFAGAVSGTGAVNKLGTGTTTLTGTNSYTGATNVNAGTLLINGNQTAATGQTNVASGATLGGTGIIGGSVTVANGGALSPGGAGNAPGALTINGALTLNSTSAVNVNFGQANVPGGPLNDLINVGGNLTLDGTLNVTQSPGGTFGPGVYRVLSYGGSLINTGLTVGAMPPGSDTFVQTSVANQVNLINTAGLAFSYWDGDAGPQNDGAVNGGSGTWLAAGDHNWANADGSINAAFANGSFAIFEGIGGTVTVDSTNGPVQALGMQFAVGGYTVQGAPITLVPDGNGQSIIRVGDGTADGANYVATIASTLSGATQLVKTDLGTLVLTGSNSYTGGTAIDGGTIRIAADANLGAVAGGLSFNGGTLETTADITTARAVTLVGAGAFLTDAGTTATLTGGITGAGGLVKDGAGTLVLASDAAHTGGTTIAAGTLQVGDGGTSGTLAGNVTDNGTLAFNRSDSLSFAGVISGTGGVQQIGPGPGTTILTGDSSYGGGTTIAAGTLQLGGGGTSGSITGDVTDNGTLAFNRSDSYTFAGLISGAGGITQIGPGTTILTADNSYGGATAVNGGTLLVAGDQSLATGATLVAAGTLGGTGIIGGDVTVAAGAALAPGDATNVPGTLTINGTLALSGTSNLNYNFGQANVVGGAFNDLTKVGGDLTLAGTLNITQSAGGTFGPGVYRVISYGGTLTNNGLTVSDPDYFVQTSVAQQVNLVNTTGLTLNYWDGAAGVRNDGAITGGDGLWQNASGNDNWTNAAGAANAPYQNGAFAVFQGTAGTVTVDASLGAIQALGMQFASDGYRIEGDPITLVPDGNGQSIIRVGDGTADGANYVATIASALSGTSQLVKTDLGTLVLTGTNSYTGGTAIDEGTVEILVDANLGDAAGGLTFDGGTLHTTADITTARAVTLTGAGTFLTDAGTTTTLRGAITGAGSLAKDGAGTLVLTSDAGYTGGTTIAAGTLQLGSGGPSGSITGNVTNNGTLAFNRSDSYTFAGQISGTGGVQQIGTGTTILTGTNSYAGPTNVQAGSLIVNGDQSAATGLTSVAGGAMLGGAGIIGGDVTMADGGTINPGAVGAVGTLTVNGGLTLGAGSVLNYQFGQANVAGGPLNDLINVGGDLTLDGTLNVRATAGGSFGLGLYRIISYGGTLTDNGLDLGTTPAGAHATVQTSIAHQVNLVDGGGQTLTFWDGDAGPKNDGAINGGNGTWRAAGDDNWTDAAGTNNAPYANGSFAILAGAPGTVSVDNTNGQVSASGLQFAANGYTVQGDAITLTGRQATIRVGDGTADGASYVATIAAALTGAAGLAKTDLGTLVLNGANSYTGATNVLGGTLAVNGAIAASAVTVHSGAKLTGTGTVGATTLAAGATIAPGGPIGTLHVAGGYTQRKGATYQVQVDPRSSASDHIAVAGSATLQPGAVLSVSKTTKAPYVLGTRYTVLTTTRGLKGTFAVTGDTALTAFAGLTGIYDAANAYLQVTQTRPFTTAAGTANQNATASGLAGLPPTSPLLTALVNLPDDAAARQAFDQLSGEIHASAKTALMEDSHFVRDAATDRIREAFCAVGAKMTVHDDVGAVAPPASEECKGNSDRVTIWGQAFGSWGHTDGDGNAASLSRSTAGFFLGADAPVADSWRIGVLGGYSNSSFDVSRRGSSGSSDDYHVGIYAGTQWGALGLRTGATYTWHDLSTARSVSFPGFGDALTANYNAGTAQVFGDLGYRIEAGRAAFEPFANLAYVNLRTDGFAENGGAAALTGRGKDTGTTFTTLGLRTSTVLAFGDVAVVARGSLGWRHAFGDETPLASLSFFGGTPFSIAGVPIAKDAAVVDVGLDVHISDSALLGISYGGQIANDAVDQTVRGNFSLRF